MKFSFALSVFSSHRQCFLSVKYRDRHFYTHEHQGPPFETAKPLGFYTKDKTREISMPPQSWLDWDTCWFTQVITQTYLGPNFYKSPECPLHLLFFALLSHAQSSPFVVKTHITWLPWQTDEALLRKMRAETFTSISTLQFIFTLEFLVFYDLLHLPMNSKLFPEGSGLYQICNKGPPLSSLLLSSDDQSTRTMGSVSQLWQSDPKLFWDKGATYLVLLALCEVKSLSRAQLFETPWTIKSMEFSRPEYRSGWPFPSPGNLPNPGIEPRSPALRVDSLAAEPQGKPKNTGVGSLSLLQKIFLT